ncbi:hypothetical protein [Gordonia terrae]
MPEPDDVNTGPTHDENTPVSSGPKALQESGSDNDATDSKGRTGSWREHPRAVPALAALIVILAVAVGVLSYLLVDSTDTVDSLNAASSERAEAEQTALDYATGAAQVDYQNLADWRERLVANTSPQMAGKLTEAATQMEQVITPLQWVSTATPIAAKVVTDDNGIYTVTAFVSVLTKNAQAPEGVQSTATYNVTVDKNQNWLITDVTGIGAKAPN